MQLSNGVLTLWSIMAIVHLRDWIIHMVSERNWMRDPRPLPNQSMWQRFEGCNTTVPLNQPPRVASPMPWHCCRRWQTWSAVWSCVCHACADNRRLSRGVKRRCRRHLRLSQPCLRRREEASLSVDFICLFGSLPDRWSVPCKGRRRATRCQTQSCTFQSKTNMHFWYQHTFSKCCEFLMQKERRNCLGSY